MRAEDLARSPGHHRLERLYRADPLLGGGGSVFGVAIACVPAAPASTAYSSIRTPSSPPSASCSRERLLITAPSTKDRRRPFGIMLVDRGRAESTRFIRRNTLIFVSLVASWQRPRSTEARCRDSVLAFLAVAALWHSSGLHLLLEIYLLHRHG